MLAVAALCVGACIGALARWQLSLWLNPGALLPWGTLAANLIGGWLIGLSIAGFETHPHLDPAWRLAIITGFLGALTTFSSFSAETVTLLQADRPVQALLLAALHLAGSLSLTWVGLRCGSWLWR